MQDGDPQINALKLNYDLCFSKSWDLVQQTQNYLKLLLHIINSDGKLL